MKKRFFLLILCISMLLPKSAKAQVDEGELGAWYMYFFNATFKKSPWGVQGDIQFRNWNMLGDLEQLLLRGGVTYKPKDVNVKFTLGYAHVTTGNFGSDNTASSESRIYQEALFPVLFGKRFYTNHRFRYEQRFVDNQDFRTRYRYNFFLNVPLNKKALDAKAVYLALYNEIFINGQRSIGDGKSVQFFDRNRFYLGVGYVIKDGMQIQLGFMNQGTDIWRKNQLQVSFHQKF